VKRLEVIVSGVPGLCDAGVAIAAVRAGVPGIVNAEVPPDSGALRSAFAEVERLGRGPVGVKLGDWWLSSEARDGLTLPSGIALLVLSASAPDRLAGLVDAVRAPGRRLLVECTSLEEALHAGDLGADGIIAKGHEAGGFVGEETTFILLQQLAAIGLPVWAYGGVAEHSAAACLVAGCAGVVLDWQVALCEESRLPASLRAAVERLHGDETTCIGADLGELCRVYRRPGIAAVEEMQRLESRLLDEPLERAHETWRRAIVEAADLSRTDGSLWLMSQDAAFAADLARRFGTVSRVVAHIRAAAEQHAAIGSRLKPLGPGAPLAQSHGTEFPILQGPMTRVSDTSEFADAVASAGALPFLALALLRGARVRALLEETRDRLGDRPWGVGILGFVPHDLREEQLAVIRDVRPRFALIAGGRPDQAAHLEQCGIATYLHVPAPGLLNMFLEDGARRFIFEGRECGGHVGPRTSMVLWNTMVGSLLDAIDRGLDPSQLHVVFAGGIHDARSAAMVAAIAAPLAARGVRIGVLAGTAYLFTEEAVRARAIVEGFQQEAIRCTRTVLLETAPGHSTRCAETAFFQTFRETRRRLLKEGRSADEIRAELEDFNLGRLRVASKGIGRDPDALDAPRYVELPAERQHADGMYMIGQVAALRDRTCTIAGLHADISIGSSKVLDECASAGAPARAAVGPRPTEVAIVGMGCLIPGSPNVPSFWRNLLNKVDAIREVPADRFDVNRYYSTDRKARDKVYSRWGGFLEPVPFDPLKYGIPPTALSSIDPFQLLSLEVVHQALQDAGYLDREFARDRASVILGLSGGLGELGFRYGVRCGLPLVLDEIPEEALNALPEWTEDSFAGLLPNVAAGRIANRFDLGGLNFTVDAACASSLAALSLAVRELDSGSSDLVIAGGVDTVQSPFGYLCFSTAQALSPRGRCRTFDEQADGIVISEGLAMLVLKRVEDARRDGDRIYAVIKAVAGSSDGRGKGLTAPRPEGQMRALTRAYAQAGFSPASVGLIEAHGTGTVAGDAAEVTSLTRVFQEAGASPETCALGSVKSMIGHTKATAGVAGVMKAALALYHRVLPPTLNVDQPNPRLREAATPFFVNTTPLPWVATDAPRRAGVSSFGFGGTNFHAVLEEEADGASQGAALPGGAIWAGELFLWTGATAADLLRTIASFELPETSAAATLRSLAARAARACADTRSGARLGVVASDIEDLGQKLARARHALEQGETHIHDPRGVYLQAAPARPGKLAFVFPGQGSQYPHMLRDLAVHFAELREGLETANDVLAGRLPRPLSSYVYCPPWFTREEESARLRDLTDTVVAQPALGAVELAVCRILASLGIEPHMTAGHSYGEYVALTVAGTWTPDTLFELSEARGRIIKESVVDTPGAMAAVQAEPEAVRAALTNGPDVWLANFNAPRQTVIAGRVEDVERAVSTLQGAGLSVRALPVACAFHSPLMAGARDRLAAVLSEASTRSPRLQVFSNSLASAYPPDPAEIGSILADHLVRPVRFVEQVRAMYEQGARTFVEVGPRTVLSGLIRQILEGSDARVISLDAPGQSGLVQLLHAVAQLAVAGVQVDLSRLFAGRTSSTADSQRRPARSGAHPAWLVDGAHVRTVVPVQPSVDRAADAPETGRNAAATAQDTELVWSSEELDLRASDGNELMEETEMEEQQQVQAPTVALAQPANGGSYAAHDGSDTVIAQFQSLMSQFLETQAAVMLAYLQSGARNGNGHSVSIEPPRRQILAPSPLPAAVAAAPLAAVASAPAQRAVAPAPKPVEAARGIEPTAAPAAPPRPVAPAAPAVRVAATHVAAAAPATVAATSAVAASAPVAAAMAPAVAATAPAVAARTPANGDVLQMLLQIVSERTGYPEDMLDLDLNIEADLGIDSIKRVEILGAFQRRCPADSRASLQTAMERITGLKTLRETASVLAQVLGSGQTQAQAVAQ
jgi:acyl transferase domain-containing protein/NAD(P)H-dependent flavin oxidoreductase YrpB (nitropropane dioxygenase family)